MEMLKHIVWFGFVRLLNKTLNLFFWTLKIVCYLIALVVFIAFFPIIYARYHYGKKQKNGFDHPNLLIFYWKMLIDKLFINVIF